MSTELRIEKYRINSADLGVESPLSPLHPPASFACGMKIDGTVPPQARKYLGYGLDKGCLPYSLQDGYNRSRHESEMKAAVLENEILRATFLLEYGGRLWSLVHKPTGRELLYVNPVFQPANLAIRNAWFSGGVEWNVSLRGHSPHTCSSMFAGRVIGRDGAPILRLWEWERLRQIPYQIDFSLPEKSPWLFVRVRIINPHGHEVPMYWWSNIAVPERKDIRVLVPAKAAYHFDYSKVMSRIPVPYDEAGADASYSTNLRKASDYFYDIEDGNRPWIAALDAGGEGLIQASTSRLCGRKLFAWGMCTGGRNWQKFLSGGQSPYIEIQAGLARTQYECCPMPAGAQWDWLEAYGLMFANAEKAHGRDWPAACSEVENCLEKMLPISDMDAELKHTEADAGKPPIEILHRGSGWGALELRRRKLAGEKPFCQNSLVFDEASLGDEQKPWLALLENGALPEQGRDRPSCGWMVQEEWYHLLRNAVEQGRGEHWVSCLHLGVMEYHSGKKKAARQAWEKSLEHKRTAWALRNLAVLAGDEKRTVQAAELYREAIEMAPTVMPLLMEALRSWLEARRFKETLEFIRKQPAGIREHGRTKTLEACALMELGRFDEAESILMSGLEVAELREGEIALSDLWYTIQERRLAAGLKCSVDDKIRKRVRQESALPAQLDFRMTE